MDVLSNVSPLCLVNVCALVATLAADVITKMVPICQSEKFCSVFARALGQNGKWDRTT